MKITVAIIEDDIRLLQQLTKLVNSSGQFTCVGAYSSAEEALREIPRRPPDVALMDVKLPGMSGVECTYRLKKVAANTQVMILTAYTDNEKVFKALAMGAGGYLLKRTPPNQILAAIGDLHQGGAPMSGYIARKVVQSFALRTGPNTPVLSPREEEVLALVAKGYVNKEIAASLGLALETIRGHLKSIYEKLHVRSRTEAAMKFYSAKES
jgi:DNA-binding NarL/FixJ family response regulator